MSGWHISMAIITNGIANSNVGKKMRKILIIGIILLRLVDSYSQITITNQQMIQPGDSVYLTQLDTSGFSPGNSGSIVLWDFSTINVLQYNAYFYPCLPIANPICFSDSVNTYLAIPHSGGYHYDYYLLDSLEYTYRGFCQWDPFGFGQETYTNPPIHMVMPFNYLNSYHDTLIGTLQGGNTNSVWQVNGYVSKHYDGYGELRLPWGISPNVARLQATYYRKDTLTSSTSGAGEVVITQTDAFEWYDLNTHGKLLDYRNTTVIIILNGTTTLYYTWLFSSVNYPLGVLELTEKSPQVSIFPNPTNSVLNLFANIKENITITNLLGEIVLQKTTEGKVELDVSFLSAGIYFIKAGNEVRKFVKE